VLLHRPLLEAYRDAFPAAWSHGLRDGSTLISPMMASGKVDVLAFIGSLQGSEHNRETASEAHRLRTVYGLGQEPGDRPARRRPGPGRTGVPARNAVVQRPAGTGLKILFLHRKIADEFLRRFCAGVSALQGGMPWEDGGEADASAGAGQDGMAEQVRGRGEGRRRPAW